MTERFTCPVQTNFDNIITSDDVVLPYQTNVAIDRIYRMSKFRFGHSTDIKLLIGNESTNTEQNDYLVGLLWTSFALILFLLLWVLLLVLFQRLGPQKVGFLSGVRSKPKKPTEPKGSLRKKRLIEQQQQEYRKRNTTTAVPFQHNGVTVALGYNDIDDDYDDDEEECGGNGGGTTGGPGRIASTISASSAKKAAKKIVKGTMKAPKKIVKGTMKAPKKIVKGTMKAPKKIVSKARKKKRKLEEKYSRAKKFDRLVSDNDIDVNADIDYEVDDDDDYDDDDDDDNDDYNNNNNTTDDDDDDSDGDDDDDDDDDDDVSDNDQNDDGEESPTSAGSRSNRYRMKDGGGPDNTSLLWTQQDERLIADYEEQSKDYYTICETRNARMRRVRATVAGCALGIIMATVLFVVMGMGSLTQSINDANDGIQQLTVVSQDTITNIQTFTTKQNETVQSTQKFIDQLNVMCPNLNTSFCTDVGTTGDRRQCDFSDLPQLDEELTTLVGFFDGTLHVMLDAMTKIEDDLNEFVRVLDKADSYYPDTFDWVFWVAAGCNILLATICLGMFVAVMLLYFGHPLADKFKWVRSYVMIPIFLLLVVLGWIFCTSFVVLSIGSSDVCIGSPDSIVETILDNIQSNFQSDVIYKYLVHYVRGCPVDEGPKELDQRIDILAQMMVPPIEDVRTAIGTMGIDTIESVCGRNWDPMLSILTALEGQLCDLAQSLSDVRLQLQCENWYPAYVATVYGAVCQDATTGLGWAASTQLVLVFFSMIILTLRVAYYELDEVTGKPGCCCFFAGGTKGQQDDTEDDDESS